MPLWTELAEERQRPKEGMANLFLKHRGTIISVPGWGPAGQCRSMVARRNGAHGSQLPGSIPHPPSANELPILPLSGWGENVLSPEAGREHRRPNQRQARSSVVSNQER